MNEWLLRLRAFGTLVWQNTDPISKWAQVLALCLAGFWTYRTFDLGEAPSLAATADVEGHLIVKTIDDSNDCRMDFHVTVENIGRVGFDVDQIRVRVWRGNLPVIDKNDLTYFNIDRVQDSKPVKDFIISGGNLIRHYSPHNVSGQTVTWVLGPQKPGIMLARADAMYKGESLDYGREWMNNPCM